MRTSPAVLLALISLAACKPAPPSPAESGMKDCGAPALQYLVGENITSYDFENLDQDIRILPPGSMMTMDHRPDRLNVDLDEENRITRIWCG